MGFLLCKNAWVPCTKLSVSKQGRKVLKDAVEGKQTQSAFDVELSNAAVRIQAQVRRRMSQRKHRERIDAHMTSKKMLTSEGEEEQRNVPHQVNYSFWTRIRF